MNKSLLLPPPLSLKNLFNILLPLLTLSTCRGYFSSYTPIHLNPGMDWQPKFKAQSLSRAIPLNAVPWGGFSPTATQRRKSYLMDDLLLFDGVSPSGKLSPRIPPQFAVNKDFLLRGKERYEIYCTPCHDTLGSGNGLVAKRGLGIVPDFRQKNLLDAPDGHIYHVIKNGKGIMPHYKKQIPYSDRWAITAYIRVLQQIPLLDKDSP